MTEQNKNEKALQKRDPKTYEKYLCQKEHQHPVTTMLSKTKKEVPVLTREGENWALNSRIDPEYAADIFAKRYEGLREYSLVYIFGLADARSICKMINRRNDTRQYIIYEPCVDIFLWAMEHSDLSTILEKENVYLSVEGINGEKIETWMRDKISYQNRQLIEYCILPNYDVLFPEICQKISEGILYYIEIEVFKMGTEIPFASLIADNILSNIPYMLKRSGLQNLIQTFQKENLKDIPAIIVSAGPSLDKNIQELKKAYDKAFIIVVDSALKAVLREEIPFHIAVTVDPRKNPDVFADERIQQAPMFLSAYSLPLVTKQAKNKLFFQGGYGCKMLEKIIKQETGISILDVETGGSVATDAFSLAVRLGFQTIILVGQDLAFTEGKGHVKGFEKDEKADKEHVDSRMLTEVESIDGGVVQTDVQMNSYRKWFEQAIEKYKESLCVINATEGGANIKGTQIMTLQEVIEKKCRTTYDFTTLLQSVPDAFDEKQRKALKKRFLSIEEDLEKLKEKMQSLTEDCEQVILYEQGEQYSVEKYKAALGRISNIVEVEKETYMDIVKLYAKEQEYAAAEDIYTAEDLSIKEIAERGKLLLEGYIEGVDICKEKVQKILLPKLKSEF